MSRLLESISKALINIGRVSAGSITVSIVPCDAATYGLANFSVNSSTSCFFRASGSSEFGNYFLFIIFTAPSEPKTAICAVGQA